MRHSFPRRWKSSCDCTAHIEALPARPLRTCTSTERRSDQESLSHCATQPPIVIQRCSITLMNSSWEGRMRRRTWGLEGASIGAPECRLLDCEFKHLLPESRACTYKCTEAWMSCFVSFFETQKTSMWRVSFNIRECLSWASSAVH